MIAFGCASCPKLTCARDGCGTEFCYHCKQIWHPNQTCDAARQQRAHSLRLRTIRSSSISYSQESGAAGTENWTLRRYVQDEITGRKGLPEINSLLVNQFLPSRSTGNGNNVVSGIVCLFPSLRIVTNYIHFNILDPNLSMSPAEHFAILTDCWESFPVFVFLIRKTPVFHIEPLCFLWNYPNLQSFRERWINHCMCTIPCKMLQWLSGFKRISLHLSWETDSLQILSCKFWNLVFVFF